MICKNKVRKHLIKEFGYFSGRNRGEKGISRLFERDFIKLPNLRGKC